MRSPLVMLAAAGLVLAGCAAETSGEDTAENGGLAVVASHYPVQFLVEQVGGDLVDVETLTAPGTEPHDLELSPQQVGEVQAGRRGLLHRRLPARGRRCGRARRKATVVDLTAGLPLRCAGRTVTAARIRTSGSTRC